MFGSKRLPKGLNCVHNDQIWKDHVHSEMLNARKIPNKWEFLTPAKINDCSNTAILSNAEKLRTSRNFSYYPLTTTGLIGWRIHNNLERYGQHARGIRRVEDILGQPALSVLTRTT